MIDAFVISLHNPTKLLNELPNKGINPFLINGIRGKNASLHLKKGIDRYINVTHCYIKMQSLCENI